MKKALSVLVIALFFAMSSSLVLAQPGGGSGKDSTFIHVLDSILKAHGVPDTAIHFPPPDTNIGPTPPDTGRRHVPPDTGRRPFPPDTGHHPFPPDTTHIGSNGGRLGGGPGLDSTFLHRLDSLIKLRRGNDTIRPNPPDSGRNPFPPDTTHIGPGGGGPGRGPGLDSLIRLRLDSLIKAHTPDTGRRFPPDTVHINRGGGPGGGPGLDSLIRLRLDSLINVRRQHDSINVPPDTGHIGPGGGPNGGGPKLDTNILIRLDSLINRLRNNGFLDSLIGRLHTHDSITIGGGPNGGPTGGKDTVNTGGGGNNGGGGQDTVNAGGGKDTVNTGGGKDTVNTGGGKDTVNTGGGKDTVNTGGGNGGGQDTVNTGGGGKDTVNTGGGNGGGTGTGGNNLPPVLPGGFFGGGLPGGGGLGPIDTTKKGSADPDNGNGFIVEPITPNPLPSGSYGSVTISLPSDAHVTAGIYDQAGNLMTVLNDESMLAGMHTLTIHAAGLRSGIYFVRVQVNQSVTSSNLIVP